MDESKVNILIVDDRPDKLLALEAVLEDLGQNIVRAYSGREALRHVLQEEFAVILLDVNMPGIDGFETAELIRQRRNSAHIPIIFLTALGDEMHVARGYSLGAVDYILTPVVPHVLRSKVAVFVDLFRKSQQVRLQALRLRQRATQLHRLASASLAINSASSVQQIVEVATHQAREIVGAHQAITTAMAGPSGVCETFTTGSYSEKYPQWQEHPQAIEEHGAYALVMATRKPMRMTQAELEAHLPPAGGASKGPPLRGLLAAPLKGRDGRHRGLIMLSDKLDGDFTDDDQAVIVQLAQIASVAIENTIFAEERETNRLKNEFLSTLSHELRTPLNAISAWVQLLRMSRPEGEIAHGLEVIGRNVKAQTRLIEDLLDLSRITAGKIRLDLRPILLRSVVEAAADALRPVVEEKGLSFSCHLDAAASTVRGDSERLQQVIWNLLSNAAKFTPSGGAITVRLTSDECWVRVSVTDTGEGIEPQFLPHVFDRFRQADSSSSRHHGGLGIGLTIVRHIVGLHGGTVTADSLGKGHGATFVITLPLALLPANVTPGVVEDRSDPADPIDGPHPSNSLNGCRVLLVDDDSDARQGLTVMLERHHAQVAGASSAATALEIAPSFRPDVVITDLAMPEQDGFSLLRELRQLPAEQGGEVPTIALTAYARPEDRKRVMEAGFNAHVAKPINPAELLRVVRECLPALSAEPASNAASRTA